MDRIQERIAYTEGFAEGMDLLQNKEGKFYSEIINILSDINKSLQHTQDRLTELEEYVEAIDEDLNDIEWDYYDGDDDDIEVDDIDQLMMIDDDENNEDIEDYLPNNEEGYEDIHLTDGYYHVVCPSCQETVLVEQSLFESNNVEEIMCPSCHEILIIDHEDEYHTEHQY